VIQLDLPTCEEIVVDNFAGGGGASLGIERGIGRPVDAAINHDPVALALHRANHPGTVHYCESVFRVDPVAITEGRPVGLAWFSPDCTHHSKAKGGKPVKKGIRGLAWVVIRWARRVRPRVIMLENVEEFADWGPLIPRTGPDGAPLLDASGRPELVPCRDRRGQTFRHFVEQIERRGYRVEWRTLVACDHGAPTIRKRLFLVARRDGLPVVWPEPTHGPGRLPWRTAAECIDWAIPTRSIFGRKRPLADNTLRRIARGVHRFVLDDPEPFVTAIDHHALVAAHIQRQFGNSVGHHALNPLGTVTAGGLGKSALVAALLTPYYGQGSGTTGRDLRQPAPTVTTVDRLQLITVTIDGTTYVLTDIGMRMLEPRELYRAQGFPDTYIIDPEVDGRRLPKSAQVRCCGNSVSPPVAEALVRANFAARRIPRRAAA
jgi:DNA (cytosine-5)-methyltransferase 1